MSKWRHLFVDGEFAPRAEILAGLTLADATRRPSPDSHSVYEELWHANEWQKIVVLRDKERYEGWKRGEVYPPAAPASEDEWRALVAEFLSGLDRALEWAASPEKLATKTSADYTMEDVLHSLAVHSSYHLGKIVAIRQAIGAWPPPPAQKEETA
ncbi:MAG TPA: DinB family protein [Pyrinomonadaceae bacterium]|nr:DinB family protein [Pyrinomonadaceae bacterium]